ncbi:MAG: hypothetical protein AVDCRST_MAG74-2312 [uncultured Pyrinomonadaceae bacterium]|uniref:Uncharacterized protein n=1 Tax=uncultured Pyrinomonadaceae bacterium TaxID=2283094 RepID=A0A6J4PEC8_9BACT|nr:MAG: hypothetical protein AVDCRST_MAG74-2312 [uncultured Pyrinomonadaceae bacterium]
MGANKRLFTFHFLFLAFTVLLFGDGFVARFTNRGLGFTI